MNKKVLFLISELPYGGASKLIKWVSSNIAIENNVHFSVIYKENNDFTGLSPEVIVHKLEINKGQSLKEKFIRKFVLVNHRIFRLLKQERFDLVVTFGDNSALLLFLYKKIFKYDILFSERGDPFTNISTIQKKRRDILLHSDYFVFQSKGACEYYLKKRRNICYTIIPNPVIGSYNEYNCKLDNTFVFSGRIELKQKRFDLAIKAFELFSKKIPNYKLYIYGDGPDYKVLEDLVEKSIVRSSIILKGYNKNVINEIGKYEIFLFTSDYEGIPNALIEAMQIGMPVIATDCSPGGASFLIKNNINGILVSKGDVNSIANAMIYSANNKDQMKKFGKKAYEINDVLNERIIRDEWLKVIDKI